MARTSSPSGRRAERAAAGGTSATRAPVRRTPDGDALSELAVQVLRLAGVLIEAGDAIAKPTGQTSARWRVLAALENGSATVATIARALGQARQSVQRVADLLAADGLAEYEEDPGDRRAMRLAITARGLRTLGAIQRAQSVWADEVGAAIGARSLRGASATLGALGEALELRARR